VKRTSLAIEAKRQLESPKPISGMESPKQPGCCSFVFAHILAVMKKPLLALHEL